MRLLHFLFNAESLYQMKQVFKELSSIVLAFYYTITVIVGCVILWLILQINPDYLMNSSSAMDFVEVAYQMASYEERKESGESLGVEELLTILDYASATVWNSIVNP